MPRSSGMRLATFGVVRSYGERLTAPAPQAGASATAATAGPDLLLHVLLALAIVLVAGRLLGKLLAASAAAGDWRSARGHHARAVAARSPAPGSSEQILPPAVAPTLAVVAELGVILYMFLVGLGLHVDHLRGRARSVIVTSHASMVTPFILGVDPGALPLSAPLVERRAVHHVRPVHGRRDVDHGVSRARAHRERPRV